MQAYYQLKYGVIIPTKDDEGWISDEEIAAKPFLEEVRENASYDGKEGWARCTLSEHVTEMQSDPTMLLSDFRERLDEKIARKDWRAEWQKEFEGKVDVDTVIAEYGEPQFFLVIQDM